MEIWVVRHGETEQNLCRVIQGHQHGKLSEDGILQAKITGKILTKQRFQHIFVSDLGRARETYEAMGFSYRKNKAPVTFTPLIREKCGGVLEGEPLSAWAERAERAGMSIRAYKPAEGESWEIVMKRADAFLTFLIDNFLLLKKVDLQVIEKTFSINKRRGLTEETHNSESHKIIFDNKNQEEVLNQELTKKDEEQKIKLKSIDTEIISKTENNNQNHPSNTKKSNLFSFLTKLFRCSQQDALDDTTSPSAKILVITHGGFIMELFNAIDCRQSKIKPKFKNDARNCSINVIKLTFDNKGNEKIRVIRKNDVSHLKGVFV